MAALDPTYDPNTPEQREYARQVADQERQQRRLSQAAAESRALAEGGVATALGGVAAKISPTATALQFAWRFYLPSFTLTSIYIVLHMLLRYVFQFKLFCRADQGTPLGGAGKAIGSAFGSDGGMSEKAWIALGFASALPLAIALLLLYALVYTAMNPFDAIVAAFSSLLGLDGGGGTSGGGGASGGY